MLTGSCPACSATDDWCYVMIMSPTCPSRTVQFQPLMPQRPNTFAGLHYLNLFTFQWRTLPTACQLYIYIPMCIIAAVAY